MRIDEAMRALEAKGTEQNRKVYARHGVRGEQFGVSYAELGKLQKKVGVDQQLAKELWKTGNHDARVLATKVADPKAFTKAELARWIRDVDSYVLADALSTVTAGSPHGAALAKTWRRARDEWTSTCGWSVLAMQVHAGDPPDDDELRAALDTIERGIHRAPNRTRYAMNNALIAIGCRPGLTKEAVTAAERIGRVEVDHGETGCKTPDAASYIEKVLAHRGRRKKA